MTAPGLRGLSEAQLLFDTLSEEARDELGTLLEEIGRDLLGAQQAATPEATGALKAGLSMDVQIQMLRVRVGLLNTKGGRSKLFYGRPVDRGIREQTVTVQRRRRVGGRLRTQSRGSRKRVSDIVATYALHVKARPGAFFIERDFSAAQARLDEFWTNLETRAGAGQ